MEDAACTLATLLTKWKPPKDSTRYVTHCCIFMCAQFIDAGGTLSPRNSSPHKFQQGRYSLRRGCQASKNIRIKSLSSQVATNWRSQLRGESQDKYPASSSKSRKRRRSNTTHSTDGGGTDDAAQGTYLSTPSSRASTEHAPTSRVSAHAGSQHAAVHAASRAASASALLAATSSMAALTLPAWPTGMSSGAQLCISSPSTPLGGLPEDMLLRAQASLPALPHTAKDAPQDALNAALDVFAQQEFTSRSEAKQRRRLDDPWACDAVSVSAPASASAEATAASASDSVSHEHMHSSSSRAQPAIDGWFVSQRLRSFRQHIEAKAAASATS